MSKRKQNIIESFNDTGFEYKGVHYKPMSLRTLQLLERIDSPFFNGEDQGIRGVMDFLYISSKETKDILKIGKDEWEAMIIDYAENFTLNDLQELTKIVNDKIAQSSDAIVEVRDNDEKK